jgi:hypothetical protein
MSVLVHIIRQPPIHPEGIPNGHYSVGRTYEVPAYLAELLVMEGYAVMEMRRAQRSHRVRPDRRRREVSGWEAY